MLNRSFQIHLVFICPLIFVVQDFFRMSISNFLHRFLILRSIKICQIDDLQQSDRVLDLHSTLDFKLITKALICNIKQNIANIYIVAWESFLLREDLFFCCQWDTRWLSNLNVSSKKLQYCTLALWLTLLNISIFSFTNLLTDKDKEFRMCLRCYLTIYRELPCCHQESVQVESLKLRRTFE